MIPQPLLSSSKEKWECEFVDSEPQYDNSAIFVGTGYAYRHDIENSMGRLPNLPFYYGPLGKWYYVSNRFSTWNIPTSKNYFKIHSVVEDADALKIVNAEIMLLAGTPAISTSLVYSCFSDTWDIPETTASTDTNVKAISQLGGQILEICQKYSIFPEFQKIYKIIYETFHGIKDVKKLVIDDVDGEGEKRICFEINIKRNMADHVVEDEKRFHKTLVKEILEGKDQYFRFTFRFVEP